MPHGFHKKTDPVNNQHSALIDTRRYAVEEIARCYRIPLHMLGDLTNVRHSTVEQGAIDFVTFGLYPHTRRWQFACRRDLITEDRDYFVEFDTTALLAGDFAARAQFMREAFNMGALSVDEIRAQIGYNPLPDGMGDRRFVQSNMQLLEAFDKVEPAEPGATNDELDGNDGPAPADAAVGEALFRSTLRRLAAVEADGILERRNKAAKLQAWLEAHEQRMRTELCDAAKATGRDIDAFVAGWMEETRERLLECHRSGKPYEEVLTSWTDRANLNDG
jgi:hypothetical protein